MKLDQEPLYQLDTIIKSSLADYALKNHIDNISSATEQYLTSKISKGLNIPHESITAELAYLIKDNLVKHLRQKGDLKSLPKKIL